MRFHLHPLVEAADRLEVGPCLGWLDFHDDRLTVEVDSDELKARLRALLSEPLMLRSAAPNTQGTLQRAVYFDEPDFAQALRERLQRRDFRLEARRVE